MKRRKPRGKRYADDEMDLDEDYQEGNPHARRLKKKAHFPQIPRWVYRVSVILIVSVLGLLVWFNRENLTPSNIVEWTQSKIVGMGIGDGYPSPISNGSSVRAGNFASVNKEAVIVSDTALTVLNSTAKELVRRQHSYSNPVMKTAGSRVLIFNLGGTGFQVEGQSKTILKQSTPENILAGSIAANGRYALATQAEGYRSKLTVYLADGTPQYLYQFSDCYVTDVALNRDGTRAAVTGVSASGGAITSSVYLFEFSDPKPKKILKYTDNLMLTVHYGGNGVIVAVGDLLVSTIGETGEKVDYGYGGQRLLCYAVDNGRTAVALAPYANSAASKLAILDDGGKEVSSNNLTGAASSVSIYGNTAAALADGKISAFPMSGGVLSGSVDAGTDARSIALHDESSVYVLGVSEIRLLDLK